MTDTTLDARPPGQASDTLAESHGTSSGADDPLTTMGHELRTPLNAVIGLSGLLAREAHGPLAPKQLEYLDHIETAGRRLLALIDDILDRTRLLATRACDRCGAEPMDQVGARGVVAGNEVADAG